MGVLLTKIVRARGVRGLQPEERLGAFAWFSSIRMNFVCGAALSVRSRARSRNDQAHSYAPEHPYSLSSVGPALVLHKSSSRHSLMIPHCDQ